MLLQTTVAAAAAAAIKTKIITVASRLQTVLQV
jgi:hypothetical protein